MPGGGVGDGTGTPADYQGLDGRQHLPEADHTVGAAASSSLALARDQYESPDELNRLRAQVADIDNERDMRKKIEKLLEVQTIQVDLQKELRMKTESLLQVEQQTSSKLRKQIEDMSWGPSFDPNEAEAESRTSLRERALQAQARIHWLERQLAEVSAPETGDRVESQLRAQLEKQEAIIRGLREQMTGCQKAAGPGAEGEVVRLQLLLQSRDRHLEELTENLQTAQGRSAESTSEVEALRHQVRALKRDLGERSEEVDRQLKTERALRADVYQLQAQVEKAVQERQEEIKKTVGFAEVAVVVEDERRRAAQLETKLAEEQVTSKREMEQLQAEVDHRVAAKEQIIKNQTATISALTVELKEKAVQVAKLTSIARAPSPASPTDAIGSGEPLSEDQPKKDRGKVLPRLRPESPLAEDAQGQRSTESMQRQIKAKDAKITKQTERVQMLTSMLERRDQQIEQMQPYVQATNERGLNGLTDDLRRVEEEKKALAEELATLKSALAKGASFSGAMESENARLSTDLAEARRLLEGRTEELRRVRDARELAMSGHAEAGSPTPTAADTSLLPTAMQRRLRRLEEIDRNLSRDVALFIQERENKIETLGSTVSLLRSTVDDLKHKSVASAAGATPTIASPAAAPTEKPSPSPVRQFLEIAVDQHPQTQDIATSPHPVSFEPAGPKTNVPVSFEPVKSAPAKSVGREALTVSPDEADPATPRDLTNKEAKSLQPVDFAADVSAEHDSRIINRKETGSQILTSQDLKAMSADQIRDEYLVMRKDVQKLDKEVHKKKELIMKLIDEANLCNAEVASLQQTLHQAYKTERKMDADYEKLLGERKELEKTAKYLAEALNEKETKMTSLLSGVLEDTSGNAATDEMDKKVTWKLKVMAPRQHEIRHTLFVVLNRRRVETAELDKPLVALSLAHHFAIHPSRIDIVEATRLPEAAVCEGAVCIVAEREPSHSPGSGTPDTPRATTPTGMSSEMAADDTSVQLHRDLVLVSIADSETHESGQVVRSAVTAVDIMDQIRNDVMSNRKIGPLDGATVDAVFINHGDMLLPFEWPSAQGRLLLREGRVVAGKYAIVTVHEVPDPYVVRIVAYDTEVGQEFVLYLSSRDILLVLDTRDSEVAQQAAQFYQHLQGPFVQCFRENHTISEQHLLDVVVGSLSFSVWQGRQILVASEMRFPASTQPASVETGVVEASTGENAGENGTSTDAIVPAGLPGQTLQESSVTTADAITLPEKGFTRGVRPRRKVTDRLFEDVLGFEGRLCVLSLLHVTSPEWDEDVLKCIVYYPKTCRQVEACIVDPMMSDRMRIVSEAGQLDHADSFSVVVVVEEIIYPPTFVIRLTSVDIDHEHAVSPQELTKPHSHVIRVTKDGLNSSHLPDISFAVSDSIMRSKLLTCIGLSTPVQGPRETLLSMPNAEEDSFVPRAVTGHVSERQGLAVQLVKPPKNDVVGAWTKALSAWPPHLRAHLRNKYGKGTLLERRGRQIALHESNGSETIRVVASVFERLQPYHHFVFAAYEPQTSREWELLADSIDIYRLFSYRDEALSQALDIANPVTRKRLAAVLVQSLTLTCRADEIVLTVCPKQVKFHTDSAAEARRQQLALPMSDNSREPEVTGSEPTDDDVNYGNAREDVLAVTPAITNIHTLALCGGQVDQDRVQVLQQGHNRLFTSQRRIAIGKDASKLFKVCVYDLPSCSKLHNYTLIASPVEDEAPLMIAGLPTCIDMDGAMNKVAGPAYALKIDDENLKHFLADPRFLEPSRQEELLELVSKSVFLEEAGTNRFKLCLRKRSRKSNATSGDVVDDDVLGGTTPAAHATDQPHKPGTSGCREVGGCFPLSLLRSSAGPKSKLAGPGFEATEEDPCAARVLRMRPWKKVCRKAQRFGHSTVVVTVSRADNSYRLSLYEPETSALYEMILATAHAASPLSILMERCDLGGRVDLVLCMHEVAFPHQVVIKLLHMNSPQEFNLRISDDEVFTMIENSRKDGFMLYFDQILQGGFIGPNFVSPTSPDEKPQNVSFEETHPGNQIFDRTQIDDALNNQFVATSDSSGELRPPTASAPKDSKTRIPVVRTQLDFVGKGSRGGPTGTLTMQLLYHGEHYFPKDRCTLMFRIHKRISTNDIALTLRVRASEERVLPCLPDHWPAVTGSTAGGRSFDTPAMALAEADAARLGEVTIWLQDKCGAGQCGAYAEFCDVPGFSKPVLLVLTDEDNPRAVRVAITLGTIPFNVLFQVVLLENSETSADIDNTISLRRRALLATFRKHFTKENQSSISTMFEAETLKSKERDLRRKLDQLAVTESDERLVMESGPGLGAPQIEGFQSVAADSAVDVSVLHMCTRKKMGRMMVFTIHRDLVGTRMYIRVVMHDPVSKRDSHLTLLHYTTQRLLNILRISRDMLEECRNIEPDDVKRDRQVLRAEMGKLVVDHMFLARIGEEGVKGDELDHLELTDGEEVEYELKMRDVMDPSNSARLTAKRKLLEFEDMSASVASLTSNLHHPPLGLHPTFEDALTSSSLPRSLLDAKEETLLFKSEKEIAGRRVLVTMYNETSPEDILRYSHNIRVIVACLQTLQVLCLRDFHEDKLELVCERRGKRHLMSVTREVDLAKELWSCLVLQNSGQNVSDITFGGLEKL